MNKKKIYALMIFILILCMLFTIFYISTSAEYENTYSNSGNLATDLIGIAETQIGYKELSVQTGQPLYNGNGTWFTKYGNAYGNSSGAWCAFFVLWCADQADIPTSIIPQSSSNGNCDTFTNWFKNNGLWKDPNSYTPQKGDIVFFDWEGDGNPDHVGIVSSFNDDGSITTIEGNVCADTNGIRCEEGFYQVVLTKRTENILGYGVPDYRSYEEINGVITLGGSTAGKAYMLPSTSSNTVWYVDIGDKVKVLCKDGDFYLIMYPFNATGKYVIGYVPKSIVSVSTVIPDKVDYYSINTIRTIINDGTLYHNPSKDSLLGSGGNDNKVRYVLNATDKVTILFELDDYYFIKTDMISGFIPKENILATQLLIGDLNSDSVIDSMDANLILKYDAGLTELSDVQLDAADINHDGKVDSADAGLILRSMKHIS